MIYALIAVGVLLLLLLIVYRQALRPMKVVTRGMDLLREQDFASRLRHVGQKDADRLVDMFNQMMDTLKRERLHVREQNEFLDLLINESPMAVIILDGENRVASANRAAVDMLGVDDLCGKNFREIDSPLAPECDAVAMRSSRIVRIPGSFDVFRVSRNGFMDSGWLHPFLLIERLTAEIREVERIAYTRVIRMMAHEVNNSVTAINSTLHAIDRAITDTPLAGSVATPLRACAERAEAMTAFIRAFADVVKIPEPNLILTDYMELVQSSLPLLESICALNGATLSVDLAEAAPLRLDPVLMQQVTVNIVKNAAESAGRGGKVTISAVGRTLTVTDNGPGLSPEAASRVFTDVFTTKPSGQGLGLMLVGEILRKHSARFSLKTSPVDSLTRFSITL